MEAPVPGETHAAPGETAQSCADPAGGVDLDGVWEVPLDWQPELDAALESIDSHLPMKRRRATDPPDAPPFPRAELSGLTLTPEILEALASRVAAKLRPAEPIAKAPVPIEAPAMKAGAVISIRFRWPLFSFTRGRRRSRARA